MTHLVTHLRQNVIAYLALVLAVGGGGGYAIAATTKPKTITVCADKRTGVLHLHTRGRCERSQTRVTWNQRGISGPQGKPGAAGQPAESVWAIVTDNGQPVVTHGLAVQRTGPGAYQITVTASGCSQSFNAPVGSVSDSYPPTNQGNTAFPVAWVTDTATNSQFTVHTGVVVGGSFSPGDHTFNVIDPCA
jgi:hypothetical protein